MAAAQAGQPVVRDGVDVTNVSQPVRHDAHCVGAIVHTKQPGINKIAEGMSLNQLI